MVSFIKKRLSNPRRRMFFIIICVFIFITGAFFYINNELNQNQKYFIKSYEHEQQLLVEQVAIRTKKILENEQSVDSVVIDIIINSVETSGRRFWFFSKNDKIIFVKNKETSKLFEYNDARSLIDGYLDNNMHISFSEFMIGQNTYIVGILTEESYILEAGQLLKNYVNVFMAIVVICFGFFVLIIFYASIVNKQEYLIKYLKNQVIENNLTIESLSSQIKNSEGECILKKQEIIFFKQHGKIYNKEVFASLLEKINHEDLFPISIIVIKMISDKINPFKVDFYKEIKPASEIIEDEHVIAEILPGVFSILLFNSNIEKTENIKETLMNLWRNIMTQKGIKIRIGIVFTEDLNSNIKDAFENIYAEVVPEDFE